MPPKSPKSQAPSKACNIHTINCHCFVPFIRGPSSCTSCWEVEVISLKCEPPCSVEKQTRTCASRGQLALKREEQGWATNLISLLNSPSDKLLQLKRVEMRRQREAKSFVVIEVLSRLKKHWEWEGAPNTCLHPSYSHCLSVLPRLLFFFLLSIWCIHAFSRLHCYCPSQALVFSSTKNCILFLLGFWPLCLPALFLPPPRAPLPQHINEQNWKHLSSASPEWSFYCTHRMLPLPCSIPIRDFPLPKRYFLNSGIWRIRSFLVWKVVKLVDSKESMPGFILF